MKRIDPNTFLHMVESDTFDFKEGQYKFYGGTDDEKSELLKDILAFANTRKSADAFIVIGIAEKNGRLEKIVGVTDVLQDNDVQQFVCSKTNRRIKFLVYSDKLQGADINVVQIAKHQKRPIFLTKSFAKLGARAVLVRSGSSTATASPDEIAEMARGKNLWVVWSVVVILLVLVAGAFFSRNRERATMIQERFSFIPRETSILVDRPRCWLVWNNGERVASPVHVTIFAQFTNPRATPLTVNSYQFEGRTRKGEWVVMPSVDIRIGRLFFLMNTNSDFRRAVRIDCGPNVFPAALQGKALDAGQTITGWCFLESPTSDFDGTLRLRVKDATDAEYVQPLKSGGETNFLETTITWGGTTFTDEVEDIGNYRRISYGAYSRGAVQVPVGACLDILPEIRVETVEGLPSDISTNRELRMNRLVVRNLNDVAIENFCSRLQLPEPIVGTNCDIQSTVGVLAGWRPLMDKLVVKGTGGKTEGGLWLGPTSSASFLQPNMCFFPKYAEGLALALSRRGDLTGIWELTINRLPAGGHVSIEFFTSSGPEATNYISFATGPVWNKHPEPDTNELRFSIEGKFQHQADGKLVTQHFLVPFSFDATNRKISSLEVQPEVGHWHPITMNFQ